MRPLRTRTTLKISKAGGDEQSLSFDRIILATGSRPAIIPSLKLDSPRVMDSTSALDLSEVPGTLLVIGGGYIGLELGTVYAALGSKVSVVEMLPGCCLAPTATWFCLCTSALKDLRFHPA